MNSSPPLARPGRPKSDAKRSDISEAAAHLFLTEGFDRTSMDTIAAAAGVSKQTVYSHFQSKEDLFRSCIQAKMAQHELVIDGDAGYTLEQGLMAVAEGYLRLLSDPQAVNMWRLVIAQASAQPRLANLFFETGPQATRNHLEAFLRHHRSKLKVRSFEDAARTFMALVSDNYQTRVMLGVLDEIPPNERKRHANRSTRQFLALYGAD